MNKIYIKSEDGLKEIDKIDNCTIKYYGDNSIIIIGQNYNIKNMNIFMGEGGHLEIGDDFVVRFSLSIDMKKPNVTVKFGDRNNIGSLDIFAGDEKGKKVIIGDDLLTAIKIYIRNSDGHVIIDNQTGKVINLAKDGIVIGNHVWLGYDVKILKNVIIPNDVVVAAGALVCEAEFEANTIIGGVPARVVRRNVNWDSRTYDSYARDN